jgi:hypothetical protein
MHRHAEEFGWCQDCASGADILGEFWIKGRLVCRRHLRANYDPNEPRAGLCRCGSCWQPATVDITYKDWTQVRLCVECAEHHKSLGEAQPTRTLETTRDEDNMTTSTPPPPIPAGSTTRLVGMSGPDTPERAAADWRAANASLRGSRGRGETPNLTPEERQDLLRRGYDADKVWQSREDERRMAGMASASRWHDVGGPAQGGGEFGDLASVRRFAEQISALGDGSDFVQVIKACAGLQDVVRDFGGDMNREVVAFVEAATAVARDGEALREHATHVADLARELSGD